jgi:hypothetical protein
MEVGRRDPLAVIEIHHVPAVVERFHEAHDPAIYRAHRRAD